MTDTQKPRTRRQAPPAPDPEQPGLPDPETAALEDAPEPPSPSGLHAKIAAVMALVERVEKRGHNSDQKYDYATAEDISEMVRKKLGTLGVTIWPDIDVDRIELRPTGTRTQKGREWVTWWVPITYWFTDSDTMEQMEIRWLGVADDYSDKGYAKALTAAEKFMLRQVFLISTGDDPEESTAGSADEVSPALDAVRSARDHRTTPAAAARRAAPSGPDPDELLTPENRRNVIGKALGAGVKEPSGKLDDALLRQIIAAVSAGEVRKISEMTVGVASKVLSVLNRMKDDSEGERARLQEYFDSHPEHLPVVEPEPEPESTEPVQPSLPAADDDDIPF